MLYTVPAARHLTTERDDAPQWRDYPEEADAAFWPSPVEIDFEVALVAAYEADDLHGIWDADLWDEWHGDSGAGSEE